MKRFLFILFIASISLCDNYIHIKLVESDGHLFANHAIKIEAKATYTRNHHAFIEKYVAFDGITDSLGEIQMPKKIFPALFTVEYTVRIYEYQAKTFTITLDKMIPEILYMPHVCLQKYIKVFLVKEVYGYLFSELFPSHK